MSKFNIFLKRSFDFAGSVIGLALLWPLLVILIPIARVSSGGSGIFAQPRVGKDGKPFVVYKLRTMTLTDETASTVTVKGDARITKIGALLRSSKLDELPQLWNVLVGQMSFVGPRPDVPGFADLLDGSDRRVLLLRPGITGPATIKYKQEEELLEVVQDPERYNREVIYPDKTRLNLAYLDSWSLMQDLKLILVTMGIQKVPVELQLSISDVMQSESQRELDE
jgi:lipopolysaccharide/colanic/teichoic acid biosynthesis glycosyltransferase